MSAFFTDKNKVKQAEGWRLTAYETFKELQPEKVSELTKARLLVDVVNTWRLQDWADAGFTVYRLGAFNSVSFD